MSRAVGGDLPGGLQGPRHDGTYAPHLCKDKKKSPNRKERKMKRYNPFSCQIHLGKPIVNRSCMLLASATEYFFDFTSTSTFGCSFAEYQVDE